MLCYRCQSPLGSGQFCLRCGTDVRQYRRIVKLSNRYYNYGLEKARVRDLTGAVEDLSRALSYNKKNITARNLLGLVLYEMGETVQALCEWVVSSNYQEENNPATEYVRHLQEDRLEMETASQGIRKFNYALDYARKGSEDLAILQLEWVTAHHPRMLKAHGLLALLYHAEGRYSKAEREIRTVLKADVGNTFCLHLAQEMSKDIRTPQLGRRRSIREGAAQALESADEKSEKLRRAMSGKPAFWLKVLLVAALILSAGIGILIPTIERRRSQAISEAVARYGHELESAREDLSQTLTLQEGYKVFLEMYSLDPKKPEELEEIHALFEGLSPELSRDTLYNQLYENWAAYLPILDKEAQKTSPSRATPPRPRDTQQ